MSSNTRMICVLIGITVMFSMLTISGESAEKNELTTYYYACIIKEISHCASKAEMLQNSRSSNLRNYAEIKNKKAIFLINEGERLVKRMAEAQVEPKEYKVEAFINNQFYTSMKQ